MLFDYWLSQFLQHFADTYQIIILEITKLHNVVVTCLFTFRYLNMSLSENSGINKQDGARVFESIATNEFGYEIAFDFLMSNIEKISE